MERKVGSFQGIAGYGWAFNFLIRDDGSQSTQGMEVSKNYFRLMGLRTALGRGFDDSDFGQVHVQSILLGYEFWQPAFGGDKEIIGKTVRISRWESPPVVIGVTEPGVRHPRQERPRSRITTSTRRWICGCRPIQTRST
ncbi:MAG TPA: ABC transporter permease [Terracidiphilus sp.]